MFPPPTMDLNRVFNQIKSMQKDNLNEMPTEIKEERGEQQVKGLKFIARKLKILLEKNRKIEYNDASRILISNFATAEKDERNIKRRVYDAINVLVAAEVVTKDINKIELNLNKRNNTSSEKDLETIEKFQNVQEKIKMKKAKLQFLQEKREVIKKMIKNKKQKKQQKIDNPYLALVKGKVDQISFSKKRKLQLITFEGNNQFHQNPLPLLQFLKIE